MKRFAKQGSVSYIASKFFFEYLSLNLKTKIQAAYSSEKRDHDGGGGGEWLTGKMADWGEGIEWELKKALEFEPSIPWFGTNSLQYLCKKWE